MDNSHFVTGKIDQNQEISKNIEKDDPAFQSTIGSITGSNDERNLDHLEDSTDGIILLTNNSMGELYKVLYTTHNYWMKSIAIVFSLGIMVAAIVYDAIVLLYYSMKYGGLYVDCHVAMTIVTVFYLALNAVVLIFIKYWFLRLVMALATWIGKNMSFGHYSLFGH